MTDEELEPYATPWRGPDGQAAYYWHVAQLDKTFTQELEPEFGQLETRTLVVWGERDEWLRSFTARQLAEKIPGARVRFIPEAVISRRRISQPSSPPI